jgi:hypothetical protein
MGIHSAEKMQRSFSVGALNGIMYKCLYLTFRIVMVIKNVLFYSIPGALSPGVKRQEPEADHSPLSSAEIIRLHGTVLN